MVGYTVDQDGHEVAFVAMASVNIPECSRVAKFTRVRMKRIMLVPPAPNASLATHAQHRLTMAVLSNFCECRRDKRRVYRDFGEVEVHKVAANTRHVEGTSRNMSDVTATIVPAWMDVGTGDGAWDAAASDGA
ncbi:hypothetical protein PsorP6_001836 [Peronosclerospora sorghi]|uniref:Uncharacterized protein n=1 Tax=Peronosclerospora sorghi TaxID=230839 RepID=A0ACC0WXS8_9STRA|nr:hypothetical protein PsorP6_001836 [Peronosclerospora sorghi]